MEGDRTLLPANRGVAIAGCVIWITAAFACATGAPAPDAAAAPRETAEPALPDGASLDRDWTTGTVRFLKGQNLSRDLDGDPAFKASRSAGDAEGVARAFLAHFQPLWRLDDPKAELALRRVDVDRSGASHVRFTQMWRGLPVPAAELIVHLDRARRVVLVSGSYFASPRDVAIEPKLDAAAARDAAGCAACAADLVVFAERGKPSRLAWRVAAPSGRIQGEEITVDAKSGDVLRRLPAALPSGRGISKGEAR